MGRDDDRPVPGLQGGTAPARAFASFMKVAVAKRPVEQFETVATLPAWQLEPDDEVLMSGAPEDYQYVDDQGNLVPQQEDRTPRGPTDNGGLVPVNPPPAASEDFLNEATGKAKKAPAAEPPPG